MVLLLDLLGVLFISGVINEQAEDEAGLGRAQNRVKNGFKYYSNRKGTHLVRGGSSPVTRCNLNLFRASLIMFSSRRVTRAGGRSGKSLPRLWQWVSWVGENFNGEVTVWAELEISWLVVANFSGEDRKLVSSWFCDISGNDVTPISYSFVFNKSSHVGIAV